MKKQTVKLSLLLITLQLLSGCTQTTASDIKESTEIKRETIPFQIQKPLPVNTYKDSTTASSGLSNRCDPNYSGCVPIASDVDCAGGKGNGPAYTSGPVKVIGRDIYGLDRDKDGYGCE